MSTTANAGLIDTNTGLRYGTGLQSQAGIGSAGLTNVTTTNPGGYVPTYYIYGF